MPVHLVDHPLALDTLVRLRDVRTASDQYRELTRHISFLLLAEATRDLPTKPVTVQTPVAAAQGHQLDSHIVVVPVLRAGLGMLDAVLALLPRARVGHIGLQRDESTAIASKYYSKFPVGLSEACVIVVDPMLATGGSAVFALNLLRDAGARNLRLICIIAAPEGIAEVERHHPQVHIYTAVIDQGLNEHKFIVPGLGDFGDRLYGT